MIYALYIIVAAAVVWLSIKASNYIDLIDKKTKLSGAFLGGVLLSAVTSLPELFTSISATVLLQKPSLCIGNILGSNIFNLLILAVMTIIFIGSCARVKLARGHNFVLLYLLITYAMMALNMWWPSIFDFNILTVSVTSVVIVVCYFLGVRYLAGEDGQSEAESDQEPSKLTVRQIVVRFVLASIGLVGLSVLLTYLTDGIAVRLNLGAGLAGALLLGIATSLPELSSTVQLFRIKNYNIATGNIVGSCLFNMIILTVADMLWTRGTIYDFTDPKVVALLLYGSIAAVGCLVMLNVRRKWAKIAAAVAIVVCYAAFLVV